MILKFGPYSPSRLDTAMCPYAFFRQYVDPDRKQKPQESLPQARGGVVHEVFENITKVFRDGVYEVPNVVLHQWISESVNRHPVAYQEVETILSMVKHYLRKPPPVLTSDAEIELRMAVKYTPEGFKECGYDDPGAFARGRADIMMISDDTTEAIVYDHKTQPNIEEADTFQMGFYAWVIWKTYPFLDRIKTVLHFSRYGYYSQPYIWTKDDLLAIEEQILLRVSIIEAKEEWTAAPNKLCQYCSYAKECPALMELFEFDATGNLSPKRYLNLTHGGTPQAIKFAGYINILDDLMKGLKEDLKEYVTAYGPIAIPGKVYDYRTSESVDWDRVNKTLKNKAYDVFAKYGIDPKMFMGFSQTFSKTVWMLENKPLLEELSQLFPKKMSAEFRGTKL